MNVSAINFQDQFATGVSDKLKDVPKANGSFDSMFQSALNMINESNELSNAAEQQEILFATGQSDSLHDLQIAQQKANVSLQYTVAVKNTMIEAYKSIVNLQF